ncbi:MAG: Asp-tRNA(Asn)/Glu-tRNA(Gln) amidotransferase subunit GatB [Patescibacteria group bacterium]|nr:Asp-tRNA(Asn)/Glu-tRNA(Gln) amidotransferase subunit GatB [Patescibacteria group bacterium]
MYQPIIGLEVHIELKTKSKMFCSCKNDPDEHHPNINICPICTAHPGTLPVINKEAVRKVIKTGLTLNCQIPEYSQFDRKNYFYPDLPKGYQISQYDKPLCIKGYLNLDGKKIRITRIHLEEDTGRLVHERDYSLVDFNRAGIPLMELVTEPDLVSAKEARRFAEELRLILRYLNVAEANMEKGEMRVEANVSLRLTQAISKKHKRKPHENILGTKVEIKNLNSFRSVERALEYEIERQTKILKSGKKVIQETRGWDENRGVTVSQREKEETHDYRYFPEPDLPPLRIIPEMITEIKAGIPELPQQRRERFKKEYNLNEKEIEIFVQNKDLGDYFEKIISEAMEWLKKVEGKAKIVKLTSNYLITDLQGLLKGLPFSEKEILITPENFAEFITLIYEGKISSKIAKDVLQEMFSTGADPSQIIEEKGLVLITNAAEIEKIIKEVISQNQKAVEDFKKGKENAFQYLIGQIMAKTKGKASPQLVNKLLKQTLDKS